MATSGTTAFDMEFTEIAEEAWERAGREMRSGYDLRTARRSMNLLTIEWQNRGINMWTIDSGSVAMVDGTATYNLPTDTIDVLDMVIRTNDGVSASQSDLVLNRISVSTYASIPNKLSEGRPVQAYIDRARAQPTVTVWPVPNASSTYTLYYWRTRRIEDAGRGVQTPDIVFRFYPAMVAGLAYYLSMKDPELRANAAILKQDYEEQFRLAAEEDREKASIRLVPSLR